MYQLGHYGVAMLAYAPIGASVALAGEEVLAILGAVICLSLSTLPDADHQIPLIEHRGITHTLLFALLVGAVLGGGLYLVLEVVTGAPDTTLVTFVFGVSAFAIVTHILGDALTPMGVAPFWPLTSRRFTLNVTPAKNRVANYALFVLGVVASVLAVMTVSALA